MLKLAKNFPLLAHNQFMQNLAFIASNALFGRPSPPEKQGLTHPPPMFCRHILLRIISGNRETRQFPRQIRGFLPKPSNFPPLSAPDFCTIIGENNPQISPCKTFWAYFAFPRPSVGLSNTSACGPNGFTGCGKLRLASVLKGHGFTGCGKTRFRMAL
jgi:hypothetical protein